MFRAVGNPDAGTDSELSKALDEAVQRGDPAEAGRLAEAITVELESGRQAASRAAAWPPGFAAMSELDRVLLAFEAMIDAKRQAAGNPDATGPSGGVRGGRWRGRLDPRCSRRPRLKGLLVHRTRRRTNARAFRSAGDRYHYGAGESPLVK